MSAHAFLLGLSDPLGSLRLLVIRSANSLSREALQISILKYLRIVSGNVCIRCRLFPHDSSVALHCGKPRLAECLLRIF
jgi:hypothetical protein